MELEGCTTVPEKLTLDLSILVDQQALATLHQTALTAARSQNPG